MTSFILCCSDYITFKNDDGSLRPRQIKALPKDVKVEVLQSFFKEFAEQSLRDKYGMLMGCEIFSKHRKELCDEMVRLFRNHEIYAKKTEEQRKEIEDFLRLHPETIEVGRHHFDRYNFDVTDNFEVVGIKKNAHYITVANFLETIADHLNEELSTDLQKQKEFILKILHETEYFKNLEDKDKKAMINYINDKFDKRNNTNFDWSYAIYSVSLISDKSEMESYIARQSINKYRKDNKN